MSASLIVSCTQKRGNVTSFRYIYQLFKAIAQCQKANVCHGDLKSENVLLSSSNWLQITDFAPFKPTYLPHVSKVG